MVQTDKGGNGLCRLPYLPIYRQVFEDLNEREVEKVFEDLNEREVEKVFEDLRSDIYELQHLQSPIQSFEA